MDNVKDIEELELIEDEVIGSINNTSMLMENNILELPLFQFTYCTNTMLDSFKVETPISESDMKTEQEMFEMKSEQEQKELNSLMGYNYVQKEDGKWVKQMYVETARLIFDDKKGKKLLIIKAFGRIPRSFESDVFFALFTMYIRKNGPFYKYAKTGKYEIKERKLYFTFYELAKIMKITPGGNRYEEFRNAIRLLKYTQYTSFGLIKDAATKKYISDSERPISLIEDYIFNTRPKQSKSKVPEGQLSLLDKIDELNGKGDNVSEEVEYSGNQLNMVRFSDLILENVENDYYKYLDPDIYFSLPSGLPRKLYGYIEKNRYDSNRNELPFVKRKYEILRYKIPIDYKYLSKGKIKLKNALKYLIKIGFIRDYIFNDEVKINGEYDDSIIFCVKYNATDTIKFIENNKQSKTDKELARIEASMDSANDGKEKPYLRIPSKDLVQELLERGVAKFRLKTICSGKSDWDIIKMIIFVDKYVYEGKISGSTGAMLASAIEHHEDYNVDEEILDFIIAEKAKSEAAKKDLIENAREMYNQYIINEIERYRVEEPIVYNLAHSSVVGGLKDSYERHKNGEIKLAAPILEQLEGFMTNGEDTDWFREYFKKEFIAIVKLLDFNAFCNKLHYKKPDKESEEGNIS